MMTEEENDLEERMLSLLNNKEAGDSVLNDLALKPISRRPKVQEDPEAARRGGVLRRITQIKEEKKFSRSKGKITNKIEKIEGEILDIMTLEEMRKELDKITNDTPSSKLPFVANCSFTKVLNALHKRPMTMREISKETKMRSITKVYQVLYRLMHLKNKYITRDESKRPHVYRLLEEGEK